MTRRKSAKVMPLVQDLPVLTLQDVAAANAMPPVATSLQLAAGPFGQIDVGLDACLALRRVDEEIGLTLDDQPVTMRLERSLLAPLLDWAGHAGEADALSRDPDLAGLMLEHLLTPTLDQVETDRKTAIRIGRVDRPPSPDPSPAVLRLRFRLGTGLWDAPCAGELVARTEASADLLRRLFAPGSTPRGDRPLDLPAPGRLLSAPFHLAAGDLAALQPGDGLVPDPDFSLDGPLVLAFSTRHAAEVEWQGDCLIVTNLPRTAAFHSEETPLMTSFDDETIAIDDVPVTLSLELDRIELPFADLGELRVGSIVSFRATRPQTVRVLANGRAFETADLVQIEDRLGVRITSLIQRPD